MKLTITILLTLSFAGIAIFGAFAMNHEMGHDSDFGSCIGATTQGIDCPTGKDFLPFVGFHLDAFKNMSTTILGQSVLFFLLLIGLSFLYIVFGYGKSKRESDTPHRLQRFKIFLEQSLTFSQQKIVRWLALHENSPAF